MVTTAKKLPRQWVGLSLASCFFLLILLLPLPLTVTQRRLVAVLVLTFTLWVTEALPLPVTALLGVTLCVLLDIIPAEQAFASFGNPILFLFLGAFMLAEAIRIHGLDRRWAEWLLSRPTFSRSPFRLLAGFGIATWAMSAWMSNTATTATVYPLAWQAFQELRPRLPNASAFGTALMLTCAYASSIGGILTPIGTPPNLIGLGFLQKLGGISIGFVQWMLVAVPIGVAMLMAHLLWVRWLFGVRGGQPLTITPERLKKPLTVGERNTALAFGLTVVLWMLTGLLALLSGSDAPFVKEWERRCPEAIPAMIGALLLFLLPDHRQERQTLTWQEAVRIDWGILLLFGGGMALGDAMFRTGLAERIGTAIRQLPFAETLWGLTAWSIAIAVLLTEVVSNTAATNMLVPMVIAAAKEANLSPVAPVLGATFGCTLAFALPIGTGPNIIVYASGLVPFRQMLRTGLLLDITSIMIIWLLLRLLCPLLGLA